MNPLPSLFSSLSHPSRLAILILASRHHPNAVSIGAMARTMEKPLDHVSKHVSALVAAGFLEKRNFAQHVAVTIKNEKLNEMIDFLQVLTKGVR